MTSYEHKVKNIYLGSPGWRPGVSHIPGNQEFVDLKSIMDGLSLTTSNDYKAKLHMPFAGYRSYQNSSLSYANNRACLRTTTVNGYNAKFFMINSSGANTYSDRRSQGYSVRCFCDTYTEPDNTRTVEAGTLGSAGIFHNTTLGLISLTNGIDKNITIEDKNVGATTIYNNGDTLSESNCGKMFQRGNYYGFTSTGTISNTSSTQVNTTGYGGSNPYSSKTFIARPSDSDDRSNPKNDNLRANSKEEYFVIE